jgi:uncharacterized membrane protein (UPF0136 family)
MSIEKEAAGKSRLPKFDSTPWLSTGIAASLVLFGLNLWALITQISRAFIPYQLSEILGMAIALALGIHCGDMIGYYRKHGKLKK